MNEKHSEAKANNHTAGESAGQCAALDRPALLDLLRRLENVQENAYSCEETFALLDEYVELVVTDEEAAALMPLVKNHLDMCPDCREGYEVLLRILEAEPLAPA